MIAGCVAGKLHLKEEHSYYHQVQGQLYVTGKKCCDLIVWTNIDIQVIRIMRDETWGQNIDQMVQFYFECFIPAIISTKQVV
jgi:hypothetical protein